MAKTKEEVRTQLINILQIDEKEFNRLLRERVIAKEGSSYAVGLSINQYIKYIKEKNSIQEVNIEELARILGYSQPKSIDELVKEGVVVKIRPGVFDANKSSQNYVKKLKDKKGAFQSNVTGKDSIEDLAYRQQAAKTKKEEEEYRKVKRINDIEEGDLIPSDILIEYLGPMAGQVNRSLDGLIVAFKREFGDKFTASFSEAVEANINNCKKSFSESHHKVLNRIDEIRAEVTESKSDRKSDQQMDDEEQGHQQRHKPSSTKVPEAEPYED